MSAASRRLEAYQPSHGFTACGRLNLTRRQQDTIARGIVKEQAMLGLLEREARCIQAGERFVERLPMRQFNRKVTQAQGIGWGRRRAFALPGVQANVVMIAAGRDESHMVHRSDAHHIETQETMIKLQRLIQVVDV